MTSRERVVSRVCDTLERIDGVGPGLPELWEIVKLGQLIRLDRWRGRKKRACLNTHALNFLLVRRRRAAPDIIAMGLAERLELLS